MPATGMGSTLHEILGVRSNLKSFVERMVLRDMQQVSANRFCQLVLVCYFRYASDPSMLERKVGGFWMLAFPCRILRLSGVFVAT